MKSIWLDDAEEEANVSCGNVCHESARPFFGVFTDDPAELAAFIPRPTTPFCFEPMHVDPMKVQEAEYARPDLLSESPPTSMVFGDFKTNGLNSFGRNYVSLF